MRIVAIGLSVACMLSGSPSVGAQQTTNTAVQTPRVLEVASIAYRDFEKKLKSWGGPFTTSEASESQKWSSDIRHYNIELMEYADRVYVTFSLRPFKDLKFNGGVQRYVLDETTGEVLEQNGDR